MPNEKEKKKHEKEKKNLFEKKLTKVTIIFGARKFSCHQI
jgi:hypothetical protein